MKAAPLLVALALATAGTAQKVGAEAPDIVWTKTFEFADVPSKKLSELRGSVVLLVFWASWSAPCRQQIPKLNALFADKGESGLVVVGISQEEVADVEPFVPKNDMRYPVAVAEADDYSPGGIPESYLIDKDGKIVWRGHPTSLDKALLDKTLIGAKGRVPAKGLEDVAMLRRSGDLAGACKRARELLDGAKLSPLAQTMATEWIAAAEKFVVDSLAEAAQAEAKKDVYLEWSKLDPVANGCQGLPRAEEAKVRLEKLLAEPRNKKEVEAGKLVASANALVAAFEFDKAYELFKEAASKFGTTKAGRVATDQCRALEKDKLGYVATCTYCKSAGVACPTHRKKKR